MRRNLFSILRYVVSFGILFLILKIIPFREVLDRLASANVVYVIIGCLFLNMNLYVSACKVKILTDKQKMTFTTWDIFKINYITRFYDSFLPQALSSGVIRFYILSKRDKKPAEAFASMVFNRFTELETIVVLGFLFWLIDQASGSNYLTGVSLLIMGAILVPSHVFMFNKRLSGVLLRGLNRWSFVPQVVLDRISRVVAAVVNYETLSMPEFSRIFGLSIAKHFLGVLGAYYFALSIDMDIGFVSMGYIRTILLVVCMLPMSVNGIGIREGSLIFMLGTYGVGSASAVALSFLLYFGNVMEAAVGGCYVAINLFFFRPKRGEEKGIIIGVPKG